MIYTSIDNKKVKEIKKLNTKKHRDLTNLFLVEGEHLVKEAYNAGVIKELILKEHETTTLDVEVMYVSYNVIKYISELETPPKIMAICEKRKANNELGDKVLILENIQDPGNLGTIIRSALAFNINTIILSNETVDLYNSKVIRASQGMLFHINIIRDDLNKIINELKNNNYTIYGTNVVNGNDLRTIEKVKKFAIIMGNEGSGMSDSLGRLCDSFIYINMNKSCESLNVAIATSIILYELDK